MAPPAAISPPVHVETVPELCAVDVLAIAPFKIQVHRLRNMTSAPNEINFSWPQLSIRLSLFNNCNCFDLSLTLLRITTL